ncbi:MAG TPA: aminomethyltransferase beta-barrel domain-containing protein, partial [Longimicrobiaceae bacterium]|nr:aminomethyltransferase beta-barrel domain-containing protein [Longimicrobiaceae bacterium]
TVRIGELNWLAEPPAPGEELRVQIRHRARAVPARVTARAGGEIALEFDQAQRAVTPGQSAVMFRDDVVLGGGRIAA